MPKGYKARLEYHHNEPGWPEPAWTHLRQLADAAIQRLGTLLQEMMRNK